MGLGFAAAQACLNAGGKVVICARHQDEVDRAVGRLAAVAGSGRIRGVAADVTDEVAIDSALDVLETSFGTLTSLIHAAAVPGPIGDITQADPAQWLEAVRIVLFGSFLATRQSCLRMKNGGRIVLFAGGGAASPNVNFTAYGSSKAGVVRLAETVALEVADRNIEINCLAPGLVQTRMVEASIAAGQTPKVKPVPASVGAEAAVFLISDRARGITGKFVAAPYDGWRDWPARLEELRESDLFTLRRIVPRDRGLDWQ